mgnify:CR=1 FL=1|jgi:hypothetical protein
MHRKREIIISHRAFVWLLLILFITTGFSAYSQENEPDSIKIKKPIIEHSPRKATIYSAVLPGLGQIYNRKYWKLPLIYGGFATFGYFINFNNDQYIKYRSAYADFSDDDPNTKSYEKLDAYPAYLKQDKLSQFKTALKSAKDGARRNRDLVVISTAVFYAANIIDASVDAHFFNFDIGDDLTINWIPAPMICADQRLFGIHCKFTF